jgi:hypothetical protein
MTPLKIVTERTSRRGWQRSECWTAHVAGDGFAADGRSEAEAIGNLILSLVRVGEIDLVDGRTEIVADLLFREGGAA